MQNWTEREDTVLKCGYEQGRPVAEIAEMLERTPGAVRGRATALGISKQKIEEGVENIGFEDEKACKHCGQISLTGDDCNCPGARRERKIQEQIERAAITINEVFGEGCEESGYKPVSEDNINTMYDAAVQIANYKIHAVAFVLPGGVRAKLTRGAKCAIKVERSETKKLVMEVEE